MVKGKYKLERFWFTPYLCDLIVGYMESNGIPARYSKTIIHHDKKLTGKFIVQLSGYMDCLREIGYILED